MPPADGAIKKFDFNAADHLQRKSLRVVLAKVFRKESTLARFLDEDLGMELNALVEDGTFPDQMHELIKDFVARGKMNLFMEKLCANEDFKDAPDLKSLLLTWESIGGAATSAGASGNGGSVGVGGVRILRDSAPTVVLRAMPAPPAEAASRGPATAEPIQRILDGDDKRIRPLAWLSDLAQLRRRVALLRIGGSGRATALLVGKDLLLTAAYVVNSAGSKELSAMDALFDFGIDRQSTARERAVKVLPDFVAIDPATPFADGNSYLATLDYALLRLAHPVGEEPLEDGSPRGWFALDSTRERLREGEEVLMIHHPLGREMGLSEGIIEAPPAESNRLQHTCPSEPGSGGAPIMDATLRLVGLHELGRTAPGADGALGSPVRIAVRADAIARDLKARGIAIDAPPKVGEPAPRATRAGKG